jgi:hypothetical protein
MKCAGLALALVFLASSSVECGEVATPRGSSSSTTHVNILLLLPSNNSYKFSMPKVLASLNMAISDLRHTSFGARFTIDLISDSCDCTGIKAPVNAMENIFGIRNHTKKFQAVFGPMCD